VSTAQVLLSLAPVEDENATRKDYVDAADGVNAAAAASAQSNAAAAAAAAAAAQTTANAALPKAGGTMTGAIVLAADPAATLQPATKQYADALVGAGTATDTVIGNRTITDTSVATGDTSTLTNLLSWLGNVIKAITGKSSWRTAPRTTLENAVKLNGDTMTGALTLSGAPTVDLHAATKKYADDADALKLNLAGGTLTGALVLSGAPTTGLNPATKTYADAGDALNLPLAGGTLSGALTVQAALSAYQLSLPAATLTYAATTDIDFTGRAYQIVALTGNVTFTFSNLAADRAVTLEIQADSSTRTLAFPAGVRVVGTALPASLAANKIAIVTFRSNGTTAANVRAAISVEA